jgi:hypothetical protein
MKILIIAVLSIFLLGAADAAAKARACQVNRFERARVRCEKSCKRKKQSLVRVECREGKKRGRGECVCFCSGLLDPSRLSW